MSVSAGCLKRATGYWFVIFFLLVAVIPPFWLHFSSRQIFYSQPSSSLSLMSLSPLSSPSLPSPCTSSLCQSTEEKSHKESNDFSAIITSLLKYLSNTHHQLKFTSIKVKLVKSSFSSTQAKRKNRTHFAMHNTTSNWLTSAFLPLIAAIPPFFPLFICNFHMKSQSRDMHYVNTVNKTCC